MLLIVHKIISGGSILKFLIIMTNELKHRFDQKHGMPVAAMIEKILLNAANGERVELPDEFQVYKNAFDLDRLQTQLLCFSCLSLHLHPHL